MVGVLGLGDRHSPSSHTRRIDSPNSIAGVKPVPPAGQNHSVTAQNAAVSSSSGRHFFSIPHWRRRILPVPTSTRKSLVGLPHTDARGATQPTTPPRRLLLEKDLPPIPSPQIDATHEPSSCVNDARVSISVQQVADTPLQPTFYLDVYHNRPMIPPPSQINSVAFTSLPNSTENVLRKTKSTHSLQPKQPSPCLERQRSRGVSMTQMFTTAKRSSILPCATDRAPPSSSLVRKSSFWSRKFSTLSPQHLTVPPESPALPALKPTSPLRVDFTAAPDSLAQPHSNCSAAKLSRRHSECIHNSATPTNAPSLSQSPVASDSVRPSTADPYVFASHRSPMRRPVTADSTTPSRSRSRSFFALSQRSIVTIPNNEPSSYNPLSQSKIGPRPRPRSPTNPPLLHRLSINLFASSSTSSAKNGSSLPSGVTPSSSSRSPRPSLSQFPPDVLKPRASESSEAFVNRLVSLVNKADVAVVLASTGDPIHNDSLQLFIERFGFRGEPLDVALRRLLMDVGLPRETQQIDRVIEAFANRYISCNPDLFTSRDHPYILAFSLIMLHTDAFNKSNKRKMSKAEYIKNTTLPGLIPEVLDCFYDNTVFAPFIFIEDPLDAEGSTETNATRPSTSPGLPSPMMQSGNALLSKPKVDPYYLITNNLLDQLRVDVEGQISLENPFRWDGTGTSWNYDEILLAFAKGCVVQIGSTEARSTTPFFGLNVGSPSLNGPGGAHETTPASEIWTIKFTKVAVLNRKDDLLEGGKKPLNRKWRPYCVALTKSQLLLFRDLSWSSTLLSWNDLPKNSPIPSVSFKPDEIISLNDTLAVLDRSYSKHLNTFRLTTRDGRHTLFQTTEDKEMNEWISRINYASAFKTMGIRMRSLGMPGKVLELTGVAAATSHLHDLNPGRPRVLTWDRRGVPESTSEPPSNGRLHDGYYGDTYGGQSGLVDLSAPELEGASQFKETFDTVKAELAAARISAGAVTENACPVGAEPPRLASRSQTIRTLVEELESRICAVNVQIDSSMHVARNIAILAPFQKSTRDRLQDTIQTMSKKIQTMRLDVTKLICHRSILLNDLAVEERNFKHATSLAMQAATDILQQHEYRSQTASSPQEPPHKSSFQEDASTGSQSLDSSTYETFRSALDFGPDWPSSGKVFAVPSFRRSPSAADSPITPGYDGSTGCYPSPDEASYLSLSTTNQSLAETPLHDNISTTPPDFPEEQAEEWNKTRAAKRVSLVKLPSNLRMSAIASKSSCRSQDDSMLKEEPIVVGDTSDWT